jgi:Holliday junction DNA helicase RuvA
MIGKLRGLIDSYGDDHVILDVGGVGYLVFASGRTLQALPRPGEAAVLFIETYVREDQIRLFGFAGEAEREWFRILGTVQGVGVKVALGVLSVLPPAELAAAIALKDITALARAPGVGKKLAERIAIELKDKAPAFGSIDPAVVKLSGDAADKRLGGPEQEAVSALVNLGYAQVQAAAAVAAAVKKAGSIPETAALIRLGLKELSAR